MNTIQNELYHSGKKGMRWGIRHGPPYPLSRKGSPLSSLPVKSRDPEKIAAKAKAKEERKQARAERRAKRAEARVAKAAEKAQRKEQARAEEEKKRVEAEEAKKIKADEEHVKEIRAKLLKNPKALRNLTDDELDLVIKRMSAEQKVIQAMNNEKSFVNGSKEDSLGKKVVDAQIVDIGKNVLMPLVSGLVAETFRDSVVKSYTKETAKDKSLNEKEVQSRVNDAINRIFARVNKQKK